MKLKKHCIRLAVILTVLMLFLPVVAWGQSPTCAHQVVEGEYQCSSCRHYFVFYESVSGEEIPICPVENKSSVTINGRKAWEFESPLADIERDFMSNSLLSSIELPDVTNIPTYAFKDCTFLKSVYLPRATTIGSAPFLGCNSLSLVVVGKELASTNFGANVRVLAANSDLTITDGQAFDYPFSVLECSKVVYDRTVNAGSRSTFVLPFDIPVDNINGTVWRLNSFEDGCFCFERETDHTVANVPYMVEVDEGATTLLKAPVENAKIKGCFEKNPSVRVGGDKAVHFGSYSSLQISDCDYATTTYDVYGYSQQKFVKATSGTLNPFRTAFAVAKGSASNLRVRLDGDGELTPTGMPSEETLVLPASEASVIGIDGRKLFEGQKGQVVIINGRKQIVK